MRCRYGRNEPIGHSNMPNIVWEWSGDILRHAQGFRNAYLYSKYGLVLLYKKSPDIEIPVHTKRRQV